MELADFLDDFVDPEFKDRLRDVTGDRPKSETNEFNHWRKGR
jgi:hypothetical protein